MIVKTPFDKDLFGNDIRGENVEYYGKSALFAPISEHILKDVRENIGKKCTTRKGEGVIIGIEDNEQCFDYYYIVFVPELGTVVYELVNDPDFTSSIE